MLRVQCVKQPHRSACLPTCVWAVLAFQGKVIPFDEVLEACALTSEGANPVLSLDALSASGWEVDTLDEPSEDAIREAIQDDRPLIATLKAGYRAGQHHAHAVVICDLAEDVLVVMDPAIGEYVRLDFQSFLVLVERGLAGPFHVGSLDAVPR